MDRETVIKVRNLRNAFGDQVIHDGLDLDVYKGEILGVVGGDLEGVGIEEGGGLSGQERE